MTPPFKTIVSFAALPNRVNQVEKFTSVIESLVNQINAEYEIHLNLPYVCEAENSEYGDISWLEKYPIKIFRIDEDLGSHNKIVPTLQREQDPDTCIICVDDDAIYSPRVVERHIVLRQRYPDCAIGFAGQESQQEGPPFFHVMGSVGDDPVEVRNLVGVGSTSYCRKFFTEDYIDAARKYWCDDMTLAYMMVKTGRKSLVCPFFDASFHDNHPEHIYLTADGEFPSPVLEQIDYDASVGCALNRTQPDHRELITGLAEEIAVHRYLSYDDQDRQHSTTTLFSPETYTPRPSVNSAEEAAQRARSHYISSQRHVGQRGSEGVEQLLLYSSINLKKNPYYLEAEPSIKVDHPFKWDSVLNCTPLDVLRNPPHQVCFWSKDDLK
jgi:hypothetical protein